MRQPSDTTTTAKRSTIRRSPWHLPWKLGLGGAVLALLLAACSSSTPSASSSTSSSAKPTITLVTNSWEGSLANNVVAQYVIEHDLHYPVKLLDLSEIPAWPATAQGKVSAVMEVWGHYKHYQTYVVGNHEVINAGLEGPMGSIGWYVPTYLMKEHPSLATWKGVKKDWSLFVTPQSAPQGQFLDGSPSYVTNDAALVKNLGINLKVIYAGSEAAQLTEIETAYKARKPIIFYWYTPQYINAVYHFSEVQLPPFTSKCAALPASQINCAYPPYYLYKIMNSHLPKTAPAVANFIKRFNWTSADQDSVAYAMAVKKESQTAAAAAFVKSHQSLVQSWLSGPFTKVRAPIVGT
ncbi:MAG: glycine betaine ABC transporter substrate-binding protein [Acidimicrobiales bacterium]